MQELLDMLKIPKGSTVSIYRIYGEGEHYNEITAVVGSGMTVIPQPTDTSVKYHVSVGTFKAFTPEAAEILEKAVKPKETLFLVGWRGDTAEDMAGAELLLAKKGFLSEFKGYAGMVWDSDIAKLIPVMVAGRYRREKEKV